MKRGMIFLAALILLTNCSETKKAAKMKTENKETGAEATLTETYWRLTELMGQPVKFSDGEKREMHIVIRKDNNRVQGHGGCNSFTGTYKLQEGNRISFSQMAATLMACRNMEKEQQLLDILRQVDNYSLKGLALTLNRARMAPFARFEAVYLK